LKCFIGVAPKLSEIKVGLKRIQPKEVIIYKILLDILGSYYRLFYGIDSKSYTKYLTVVLEYYKKVDDKKLAEVVNTLMESLNHLDK
jgi:hypothetical protein